MTQEELKTKGVQVPHYNGDVKYSVTYFTPTHDNPWCRNDVLSNKMEEPLFNHGMSTRMGEECVLVGKRKPYSKDFFEVPVSEFVRLSLVEE